MTTKPATIRALTICQPYPFLIVTPAEQLPPGFEPKRCENRVWRHPFRGELLIHAGLSTEWMPDNWPMADYPIVRGAALGVCDVLDCVAIEQANGKPVVSQPVAEKYPWLTSHVHAEGPFGFLLSNVRRFREPYPLSGQRGFFDVEIDLELRALLDHAEPIADPFAAPINWRERLLSMPDAEFERIMSEQFAAGHFLHSIYREKGRPAVITFLINKLTRQPEPVR